jgi:glutaminyl-peptide cyclotransferase
MTARRTERPSHIATSLLGLETTSSYLLLTHLRALRSRTYGFLFHRYDATSCAILTFIAYCTMPTFQFLLGLLALLLSLASAYGTFSDDTLKGLPNPGDDFNVHHGALLSPILRTRVSGTPGSTAVLNHFVDFFRTHLPKWTLEFQNSSSTTPTSNGKEIPFVNLIATRDPPGTQVGEVGRLALVAHYDSKITPAGFIGATDSAAPCAMLMHAARSIDEALTEKWEAMAADGTEELEEQKGVQIIFLDGEEAFLSWTDTDSLYGAR